MKDDYRKGETGKYISSCGSILFGHTQNITQHKYYNPVVTPTREIKINQSETVWSYMKLYEICRYD